MTWLKHIAILTLSLSIAFAGFPAQAKLECPMAKMMQMQDMKDCKSCDKTTKHEQKKNGCCDAAACNAKCSAMGGGVTMNLPTTKTEFAVIGSQTLRLYPADVAIASAYLNTQERPPKSLS